MKFVITGHMRSGQHAIHLWMISGFHSVGYFTAAWYNNQLCAPWRRFGENAPPSLKPRFRCDEYDLEIIETEEVPLWRMQPWPENIYGPRDSLVWVVVLRAFPNWLASRAEFERKQSLHDNKTANPLADWVIYAEHALATAERSDTVTVLYDLWVTSQDYRNAIAAKLNLDPSALSAEHVPCNGGGSSFIGVQHEQDASRYVERYKILQTPREIDMCLEPRCRALTEALFGSDLCDPMYAHLEKVQKTLSENE